MIVVADTSPRNYQNLPRTFTTAYAPPSLSLRNFQINSRTAVLITAILLAATQSVASAEQQTRPELIERVQFDWNHSGRPTTFSLFRRTYGPDSDSQDQLQIEWSHGRSWRFTNPPDDEWAPLSEVGLSALQKQNLSSSKRFLFVSSHTRDDSPIYLILKGAGLGCCVGSLTVLTPGEDGKPHVVFQSETHLLAALLPTKDGRALELIGQPSDSESQGWKNAQSYDPYRVYLLDGERPAHYELERSKEYTLAHYCQWRGPQYDERFVAVGKTTGAAHCRAMSENEFTHYREKHPELLQSRSGTDTK